MNEVRSATTTKLKVMGVAFAVAAVLAGGILSGCGGSSNTSSIESTAKKQIEAGTKQAEEGLKEGTKAAENAVEEAKGQINGKGSAQVKEGLKEAEKGIEAGKSEGEKAIEEAKKETEEATK
jgi:hypothetical protein